MYTVLVVDDEKIDRDGIRFLIERSSLPLDVIEADSGLSALEVLSARTVRIMVTDIRMARMDGLELTARALERNPALKIVIFSAFGEFEYAQRAMGLGVRDYLLKPIKPPELEQLLTKIVHSCREEDDSILRRMVTDLVWGHGATGRERPDGFMWPYGLDLALLVFREPILASRNFDVEAWIAKHNLHRIFPVPMDEYQVLLFSNAGSEAMHRAALRLSETMTLEGRAGVIGLGGTLGDLGELPAMYRRLEKRAEVRFFHTEPLVLSVTDEVEHDARTDDLLERARHVGHLIRLQDPSASYESLNLFDTILAKGASSAIFTKHLAAEMATEALSGRSDKGQSLREFVEAAYLADRFEEIRDLCMSLHDEASIPGEAKQEHTRQVIETVVKILRKEYGGNINLEVIADRVHLSPNYLSYLFKKETGQSFMKYLTDYRIEKAKELLRATTLRIGTICEAVGYSNTSYFCSIFRSHVGCTPAQYRDA